MALTVEEIKTTVIKTSDGKEIKSGDKVLLNIKGQDIICTFNEIDSMGYIVTMPFTNTEPNRYRTRSIDACYKLIDFNLDAELPFIEEFSHKIAAKNN